MLPNDILLETSVGMKDLLTKQEFGAWQSPVHAIPPACVHTRTLSGRQVIKPKSGALTLTEHPLFLSGYSITCSGVRQNM